MSKSGKIILLDADVISHFIACKELLFLHKILSPHSLRILDAVYAEIARIPSRKNILDTCLAAVRDIERMAFPNENMEIKREFALIKRNTPLIGEGERACMAVAKYHKDVIASSNYRDIAPYCSRNAILYIGTLDILTIALNKGVFDAKRCDDFIATAKSKNNARFPAGVNKISDYKAPDLSFI